MKRLLLLFSLSLLCAFNMNAQITDFINDVSTTVGVYKSGNTLYIGSVGNSKIYTADLSNPNPVAVDFVDNISFPTKFVIVGNDLYLTYGLNNVGKIDLTSPTPSITFVLGIPGAYGLALKDNFLYVSQRDFTTSSIVRFDYTIANPTFETLISTAGLINDIAFNGNDLYFAYAGDNSVSKIDVTQANPTIEFVATASGVLEVAVNNDYLFYSNNYINKLDLTDSNATPETLISGITAVWDIEFDGDILLLAQQTDQKVRKFNTAFIDPTTSPDYAALLDIYATTDGDNWPNNTNWLDTTKSLYSWHGVSINENNRVTGLILAGNNITGAIPNSIFDLDVLENLNLFGNNLSGTLPTDFQNLTNLQVLNLSANQFTGTIPTEFSALTNLTALFMENNTLEGVIPFNSPNAEIYLRNNYYDFSDIEPFLASNNFVNFFYSPQLTVDDPEDIQVGLGVDLTFTVDDTDVNREAQDVAMTNTYQWFKDFVAIPGATNTSYTIFDTQEPDSGTYYCEIRNTLVPDLVVKRPDIILLVDDALSVIENERPELKIYPNPVKDWLSVELNSVGETKLELVDLNGRIIQSKTATTDVIVLSTDQLQSGTYLLRIYTENGIETRKLLKK